MSCRPVPDDPRLTAALRARLEGVAVGESLLRGDDDRLWDVTSPLEFFIPAVLRRAHPLRDDESLDGTATAAVVKLGERTAEWVGHVQLITVQTWVVAEWEAELSGDLATLTRFVCKLGERDPSGALRQLRWGTDLGPYQADLLRRRAGIAWAFEGELP